MAFFHVFGGHFIRGYPDPQHLSVQSIVPLLCIHITIRTKSTSSVSFTTLSLLRGRRGLRKGGCRGSRLHLHPCFGSIEVNAAILDVLVNLLRSVNENFIHTITSVSAKQVKELVCAQTHVHKHKHVQINTHTLACYVHTDVQHKYLCMHKAHNHAPYTTCYCCQLHHDNEPNLVVKHTQTRTH